MVDDMITYLETVRDRPVWRPVPPEARSILSRPVPLEPEGAERAYEDFLESVLPYPTGNIHPRFWGWVMGTGTPLGMLSEMLAATMNCNVSGFDDAATRVESQVLDWLKETMGFPASASGLLVSGGSMANLVGLAVARHARAGFDVRRLGVAGSPGPMTLYASREVHNSSKKAVELLGLGSDALRLVPVDSDYRVDVAALDEAVRADRAAGRRPFCVIGSAGTANTGAIDDLAALSRVCRREGLWFHVDGAFGALAALSPSLRPRLAGMEEADSLAFDLHKWGYLPLEVGCTLVRREEDHRGAFASTAEYLVPSRGGVSTATPRFSDYGVQLSRGFRALKVWMCLKEHGALKLGRIIRQNVDQAQGLARRIRERPELELLAPVPLNVVCFRYVGDGGAPAFLNDLNQRLLVRLHESGVAVPSYTTLEGRYALRVAITNHRSRSEDFDLLVSEVVRLGRELASARRAGLPAGATVEERRP